MRLIRSRASGALLGTALLASGVVAGCGLSTQSATTALQAQPTAITSAAPRSSGGAVIGVPAPAANKAGAPALVRAAPEAVTTAGTTLANAITVSGTGQIQAQPDEAFVNAGVQTRAQTARDAQTTNNRQMQAVISAVKALGIPAKNIQTSGVSLYPVYGPNQNLEGYEARNNISVTVEQIDQAGQVLDAAVSAGANQTGGVSFGLKNDAEVRNKALAAAIADARGKAEALAGAAGVKITSVQAISEASVNVPMPAARVALGAAAASQAAVPVEPGQLTVSATVTVVYGY